MTDIVVRPLGPQEHHHLFALPRRLYGTDPCWVAPLEAYERPRLRSDHPLHRTHTLVLLGAFTSGRCVGTMSVLRDPHFDADPTEKVAWWGWFAAEPRAPVVRALFDAARSQAAAWGAHRLRGPRNLTRFDQVGLTVQGHDTLPPMLQAHHPPGLQALVEGAGLVKHHDVLAYDRSLWEPDGTPSPIPAVLQRKAAAARDLGLTVRSARWRSLERDLTDAHRVLNASYATVPDVHPMPEATFKGLGRLLAVVADTRLIQLAYDGDTPVAFTVCLPEIAEAQVAVRGRLWPWGWWRGLAAARRIHTAAFKLIGVVPRLRGSGLHAAMITAVVEAARDAGYTRVDGSVIDERNGPMRAVVEGAGMTVYRRYRVYEMPVGPGSGA